MNKLLLTLAVLLVFASCETKVDLDVTEGPKNIIIDGGITDKLGADTIYLSQTQDYNSPAGIQFVTGATLVVTENGTLKDTLLEVKMGTYVTQKIGKGTIGSSYQLYLKTAVGEEYESTIETIQQTQVVDSLYFMTEEELGSGNVSIGGGDDEEDFGDYVALIALTDNPTVENSIRYKVWVNGKSEEEQSLYLYDDEFVNGQHVEDAFTSEGYFVGDKVRVEQISLTKQRYQYLGQLGTLVSSDGGPFDAAPSPLIGNVFKKGSAIEYALGYFQATSSITVEGIVK